MQLLYNTPNSQKAFTREDAYKYLHQFKSSPWDLFTGNVWLGYRMDTSIGALSTYLSKSQSAYDSPLLSVLEDNTNYLSLDEWKESTYYREGIKYDKGMTQEIARNLADLYDDVNYQRYLNSKSTGFFNNILKFGGRIAGNILDPLNFIPFVGVTNKLLKVGKLGRISSSYIIRGATEAGIGTAAVTPFIKYSREQIGDKYEFNDAVLDIALGSAFGAALGGMLSLGKKIKLEDKIANVDLEATRNISKSFSKAVDDLKNGDDVILGESSVAAVQKVSKDVFNENLEPQVISFLNQKGTTLKERFEEIPLKEGEIETHIITDIDIDANRLSKKFYKNIGTTEKDFEFVKNKYASQDELIELQNIEKAIEKNDTVEDIFYYAKECLLKI